MNFTPNHYLLRIIPILLKPQANSKKKRNKYINK